MLSYQARCFYCNKLCLCCLDTVVHAALAHSNEEERQGGTPALGRF